MILCSCKDRWLEKWQRNLKAFKCKITWVLKYNKNVYVKHEVRLGKEFRCHLPNDSNPILNVLRISPQNSSSLKENGGTQKKIVGY